MIFNTIAKGFPRMGVFKGVDPDLTNIKRLPDTDGDKLHIGPQMLQLNREIERALLVVESCLHIVGAIKKYAVTGYVGWHKKGETLNMVPVGVAEEKMQHPFTTTTGTPH